MPTSTVNILPGSELESMKIGDIEKKFKIRINWISPSLIGNPELTSKNETVLHGYTINASGKFDKMRNFISATY